MYGFAPNGMGHLGAIRVPRRGMWGLGDATSTAATAILQANPNGTVAQLATMLQSQIPGSASDAVNAIQQAMLAVLVAQFPTFSQAAIIQNLVEFGTSSTLAMVSSGIQQMMAAAGQYNQQIPGGPPIVAAPVSAAVGGSVALPSTPVTLAPPTEANMSTAPINTGNPWDPATALAAAQQQLATLEAIPGMQQATANLQNQIATNYQPAQAAYAANPSAYDIIGGANTVGMQQVQNSVPVGPITPLASGAPNAGTPAAPATGSGTGNWFTDEMISGVPNWTLAAGGGAVILFMLMKK